MRGMLMIDKIILIVLDSVGIGELPDAANYSDEGSDTLGNIIRVMGSLEIPNLVNLGIGNIQNVKIPYFHHSPIGNYGKANEISKGKDTTTGHWEIAGIHLNHPFPTYPNGFPMDIMKLFHQAINRETLWNKPASGSEIINVLGDEHIKTSKPIVYTSADSVFQIAAHEDVIPLETLYEYCRIARKILQGKHAVGRVIARPFNGTSGNYKRTERRKDFSLEPIGPTILDVLKRYDIPTYSVGKINDIFSGRGISDSFPAKSNEEGVKIILRLICEKTKGLIFANLIDFDMQYGHRNDVEGYAKALEAFDKEIPKLMQDLEQNDVLILTADHGCDPTLPGSDHTREYIPILLYGHSLKRGIDLGIRESFGDIGATVLDLFNIKENLRGKSFKNLII